MINVKARSEYETAWEVECSRCHVSWYIHDGTASLKHECIPPPKEYYAFIGLQASHLFMSKLPTTQQRCTEQGHTMADRDEPTHYDQHYTCKWCGLMFSRMAKNFAGIVGPVL